MCSQRPAHKQKNTIGSHAHWPGPVPILRVLAPTLPPPFLVRASSPITPGPALLSPRSPAPSPSSPSLFPSCPALPLYPISSGHSTHVAPTLPPPHTLHTFPLAPLPRVPPLPPNPCWRTGRTEYPTAHTQSLGTLCGGPVASILAVAKSPHGANSRPMARTVGPSEYLDHGLDQSPRGANGRPV